MTKGKSKSFFNNRKLIFSLHQIHILILASWFLLSFKSCHTQGSNASSVRMMYTPQNTACSFRVGKLPPPSSPKSITIEKSLEIPRLQLKKIEPSPLCTIYSTIIFLSGKRNIALLQALFPAPCGQLSIPCCTDSGRSVEISRWE